MELKEAVASIEKLTADMRADVEKATKEHGESSVQVKEAIERGEKMSADITKQLVENKERLDKLETAAKRPGNGASDKDAPLTPERKAVIAQETITKFMGGQAATLSTKELDIADGEIFWKYIKSGGDESSLNPIEHKFRAERKSSLLSDDSNAGYLAVPNDLASGILANVRERSPVRQIADVRSGNARAIEQPRRTGEVSASWTAEAGTRAETTGLAHEMEVITAHEMYAQLHASRQMLADSRENLEAYFNTIVSDAFGVAEGTAFISGTGVGQPAGAENTVGSTKASSANVIAADDLVSLQSDIKQFYRSRATWLVNRTNVARIRILKDGQGQYLWRPGLMEGQAEQLLGRPMLEATDMDSTEANASNVALFADWRSYYRIYDRLGMTVLRDPFTAASTGTVKFHFYRRVGGGVVLPEASVIYTL